MNHPNRWKNRVKHGHAIGGRSTPEFRAWMSMLDRCQRESHHSYHRYGGRGIKVCAEWAESFQAFFDHIGPRPSSGHSLDRKDNDRGYEPGNVRWATRLEQASNQSTLRLLTYKGRTLSLSEWAREVGIGKERLHERLKRGWPLEDALNPARRPVKSKVSREAVLAIREALAGGMYPREAAEKWGLGKTTVIRIRDRESPYKE